MTGLGVARLDRRAYEGLECVNWSTLKYATESALAYRYCLDHDVPAETDAMRLGRAIHTAVFEPDLFADEYVVWEGGMRRGGEWEQFRAAHLTRTILRPEDAQAADAIRCAVRSHPAAGALLAEGQAEVSVTWSDPDTGVACKGRVDWLSGAALVDLKSTRDIDMRTFGMHVARYLYHCQLAFYQMGLRENGLERATSIIAVQSEPPYEVAVYDLNDDQLWAGEVVVKEALALVAKCRREKRWPGRYQEAVELMLPGYAYPTPDEEDAV
jgi:hypothetical protein